MHVACQSGDMPLVQRLLELGKCIPVRELGASYPLGEVHRLLAVQTSGTCCVNIGLITHLGVFRLFRNRK